MKNFEHWDNFYKKNKLYKFNDDRTGLLWLKTKSIIRKEKKLLKGFIQRNNIILKQTKLQQQFVELFDLLSEDIEKSHKLLDDYFEATYSQQVANIDIQQVGSELDKLTNYKWGGDYRNSLDKSLISKYVKIETPSLKDLESKFETEINCSVQNYVLSSWYNYWCSILIENIFKSHSAVLPVVGKIKSVDFFVNNIPFDLKITDSLTGYIRQKRKEKGYPVELTFLKQKAKEANIAYDKNAKPTDIFYEITEKMKDRADDLCKQTLQSLKSEKIEILKETQENPKILAKWLYENQGEMRFGSENRLFLVLVDTDDFSNSWKLKRNIDLLKPAIVSYLDNFKNSNLKVNFEFKGKSHRFSALADVIFVVK